MTSLIQYGWSEFHQKNFALLDNSQLMAARVIAIKGFKYTVITDSGEKDAELAGRLLFGKESSELPKVGDWVGLLDYGDTGYIVDVLPRKTELARKNAGNTNDKQVLAANIDVAIVVQALDRDFNLMRLDRYLVQIIGSGITPVVVLNKSDLVTDVDAFVGEVKKLQRNCLVITCSTLTGNGMSEVAGCLESGKTYVLIGSSGVGKSSLLNHLSGPATQKISATSAANSKGRHTTTSRELFIAPKGSLVIDTPGMREFGIALDNVDDSSLLFPAIATLSEKCRFTDCSHQHENGCAVLAALNEGQLDPVVYNSYVKLIREQRRFQINADEKKRLDKLSGRMVREAVKNRKRFKY